MGTKHTPTTAAGILVPWAWSTSPAAAPGDYRVGVDYTEASPYWGRAVWSGTGQPPVGLWPTGEPDTGLSDVQAWYVRGGAPSGIVARSKATGGAYGNWYGRDYHTTLTGYRTATTHDLRSLDILAQPDGTCTAIGSVTSGGTCTWYTGRRTTAGVWTWTSLTSYATSAQLGCCLCLLPDGGLGAYLAVPAIGATGYVVELWRSADYGATWTLQTSRAGDLDAAARILRASAVGAGQVVLFATSGSGTATQLQQLASLDGGYTVQSYVITSRSAAWSALWVGGACYVLTENHTTGSDAYHVHKMADATSNVLATAADVLLVASDNPHYSTGGTLWQDSDGYIRALVGKDGGAVLYGSDDYGVTFDLHDDVFDANTDTPTVIGEFAGVEVRGQIVILAQGWDGSAVDVGDVVEVTLGGLSDVTPTMWPARSPVRSPARTWCALDVPQDADWTLTTTGTPGQSITRADGQRVVNGAGDTYSAVQSPTVSSTGSTAVWDIVKVTSGTLTITAGAGATPRYAVAVDITPTQIRAYDASGAAGAYANHGAADYIEVLVVVANSTQKGTAYYRAVDTTGQRAWTALTTITGLGSAAVGVHTVALAASSAMYWRAAWTDHGTLHPLADGVSRPADLAPIPLADAAPTYIIGGLSLAERSGGARVDGTTHTFSRASNYAKNNLLPSVSPSPRRGWRSAQTASTEVVGWTLDYDSGNPVPTGSDLWAIYLDKIESVPRFQLVVDGATVATVDLRIPIAYSQSGGGVRMSTTGTLKLGPWVAANELAGGYFQGATGAVVRIVGNTSGALTIGSPVAERRAVLRLEDEASSGSGSGYIWPPRALVLAYLRGGEDLTSVALSIAGTEAAHPDGYRAIGLACIGPVRVLGRAPDRSTSLEMEPGSTIETMPDGSRYTVDRAPNRRRVEVGILDSHVDVSQVRSLTASPDYIVVSAHASAAPAAARFGDPLHVVGLVEEVGRSPVVWLPRIPIDSGSGDNVVAYTTQRAGGALYSRITNAARIEQVPAGVTGVSDMYRLTVLAFEEEV